MANIIKTLKNKGDVILPRTVTSAITLPDGSNLEEALMFLTDEELLENPIYVQANEVEIADSEDNFTSTDVEGALGELAGGVIVESGSNANGKYVKWADGTMECRHKVNMGARNAFGSGNFTDPHRTGTYSWVFPISFYDVPVVSLSFSCNTSDSVARLGFAIYKSVSVGQISFIQACSLSSSTDSTDVYIDMIVKGRWKA